MSNSFPHHQLEWPYETRLEITTSCDLLLLSEKEISRAIEGSGATIVARDRTDLYASYILSLSSLFVFKNAIIIICCSQKGLTDTASFLLDTIGQASILTVSLEQRQPPYAIANSTLMQPLSSLPDILGRKPQCDKRHSLYTVYDPSSVMTESEITHICDTLFPSTVIQTHTFQPSGWSLNLLLNPSVPDGYITIHYSQSVYVSAELYCITPSTSQTYQHPFSLLCSEMHSRLFHSTETQSSP